MATPRLCSIPDCGKSEDITRGWCRSHYSRWQRHGDPLGGDVPIARTHAPLCSIPGCDKPFYSLGFCASHYRRQRRYGNPLAGLPQRTVIRNFFDNVVLTHADDTCLIWPFATITSGYGSIFVDGRNQRVPRLVCEHVNGQPPTQRHEAAHSCGNGHLGCCSPKHLSWKTHKENMADKEGHGTLTRGEAISHAKLTEAAVRSMKASGFSNPALLAETYGVSVKTIHAVRRGVSWAWVS